MEDRKRIYLMGLMVVVCSATVRAHEFSIDTTWNGGPLDHTPIKISLSASPDEDYLLFNVSAPFFNDPPSPPGPPGQPFYGLWEYEVVEAFFLNDANQYLEVEVCPWGQHIVLLLNGQRVTVRHSLQMKVTTQREKDTWTGSASIPISYLPENVTKFNAYGIHGSGTGRVYESLYPASSTASAPDFHALEYFKPIDLSSILPTQASKPMSQLWSDALQGLFRYEIATTWDNRPLSSPPVQITLQGFQAGVEMNVTAPFYNDTAPPDSPDKPFYGLWDYEVVEMFFLNKNNEYLEVELGPWGHYLLLLLQGERNAISDSLSLKDYIITERTDPKGDIPGQWKGSAMLPPDYFPPNVTLMNAYAIHGKGKDRQYQALYPAPKDDPDAQQPDFHRLDLFRAIDFEFQVKDNKNYSQVWLDAMESITTTPSGPEVMTTLGPLRPGETVPVELPEPTIQEPVEPTTLEPLDPDTTEAVDPATSPPSISDTRDITPKDTRTRNSEQINMFTPKSTGTTTAEPTENIPSTDVVTTETVSDEVTTLLSMTPVHTTLKETSEVSTLLPTSGNDMSSGERRRPHPQRVNTSQDRVNFASLNINSHTRRHPMPPTPLRVRPNRRVVNQRLPSRQGFPLHINLHPEDPFIQRILSQQQHGFQAPGDQMPPNQKIRDQQSSPRDQQVRNFVRQQSQPPHNQHFRSPHDQQVHLPHLQETHPSLDQEVQSPVDQLFKPSRDEQFQPPADQQFKPPLDEDFQPQEPKLPRDQQFQLPDDPHLQPPPDQEFLPPRDQQFQSPHHQQVSLPEEEQQNQPRHRTSSAEQHLPLQEEDAPLAMGEENAGIQGVEEILTSLTEEAPALPPPHPICFSPGLVPDEHRCWVFHECELENGQWQVYSWKCIRGHVYDPFNVACVPGRCRRRG